MSPDGGRNVLETVCRSLLLFVQDGEVNGDLDSEEDEDEEDEDEGEDSWDVMSSPDLSLDALMFVPQTRTRLRPKERRGRGTWTTRAMKTRTTERSGPLPSSTGA